MATRGSSRRQGAPADTRHAQQLADSAPALLWLEDASGTRLSVNQTWLNFTGRTSERELGDGWLDCIHPDDRSLWLDAHHRALEARSQFTIEYRLQRYDGEYRLVFDRGTPRFSRDGTFEGFSGAAFDITEAAIGGAHGARRNGAHLSVDGATPADAEALMRLRHAEEQLTLLIEASGGLIESMDLDDMLPRILKLSSALISADAYALWGVTEDRREWRILASSGLSDSYLRDKSVIQVDDSTPAIDRYLAIEDVFTEPLLQGRTEGYEDEGIKSILVFSLIVGGQSKGTLTFYWLEPHTFTDLDIRVGSALANLAASAIGLARMNAEQRRFSERIEQANRRLRFIAEASSLLAESLDYAKTLQAVADLAVPDIADWCAVHVANSDGTVETVAVAHPDRERLERLLAIGSKYPPGPDAPHGWQMVMRTGRPDLIEDVMPLLEQASLDEDDLRDLRAMGLRSSLVVPLIARGIVLGAITLVTNRERAPLSTQDIPFVEELARRAAVAIDNAQLYHALETVALDLREANAVKDEFLSMVSHELKTPITTILGNSELLIRRGEQFDPEQRAGSLEDINESTRRLEQLVENLLALSRLDAGKRIDLEPIIVRHELQRIVNEFQEKHRDRQFNVSIDPMITPVSADLTYFEQVLQNLLSNAVKYSPRGAPIDVKTERRGDELAICVMDRGVGIPADAKEQIFEPFYRLPQTISAPGAGIGLAVCKRLVEVQGGRIEAIDREGGGTIMQFTLRADDADLIDE